MEEVLRVLYFEFFKKQSCLNKYGRIICVYPTRYPLDCHVSAITTVEHMQIINLEVKAIEQKLRNCTLILGIISFCDI